MSEFSTVVSETPIESAWANAIIDHAFEKPCSFIVRKNGSNYETIYGSGSNQAGKIFGTPSSNAATVIQALFTELSSSSTKARIFFKNATYSLGSTTITASDIPDLILEGETRGGVIIEYAGTGDALKILQSSVTGSLVLRNFTLSMTSNTTWGKGITITNLNYVFAERVMVKNSNGVSNATISANSFGWYCVYANGSRFVLIDCQAEGFEDGFYVPVDWLQAYALKTQYTKVYAIVVFNRFRPTIIGAHSKYNGTYSFQDSTGAANKIPSKYSTWIDCVDETALAGGGKVGSFGCFQGHMNIINPAQQNLAGIPLIQTPSTGTWTIRGFPYENSGTSTGTGAQQTIAHGLATTPTRVFLTDHDNGANPYQSAAADATNIYVTAVNTKKYQWKAWVV